MKPSSTYSGLESIGEIPWGSHFCNLYNTKDDFFDSLVPYFKAGLENNESCLWITAEPFTADDARSALNSALPNFAQYESREQINIVDYRNWYLNNDQDSTTAVLDNWINRQKKATSQGYEGLRISGNTSWLSDESWPEFMKYESLVNETFRHHRIVGLCSYCLDNCNSHHLLDVMHNHEFALVRRNSQWELIESAQLKLAKSELHKVNSELEQRVAVRTQALEMAMKTRETFLGVASHELKTPISIMQIYLQGALRKYRQADTLNLSELEITTERGLQQCKRLTKLVNNLLDVNQTLDKAIVLNKELVDLSLIIKNVADNFSDEFKKAECAVSFITKGPFLGYWDAVRIELAIVNIFDNAIKFASGEPIEIALESENEAVIISITDQGCGIPEDQKERIFERFIQLNSHSYTTGFGLGLWQAKETFQASGGDIFVESELGKGTTFIIKLPIEKQLPH